MPPQQQRYLNLFNQMIAEREQVCDSEKLDDFIDEYKARLPQKEFKMPTNATIKDLLIKKISNIYHAVEELNQEVTKLQNWDWNGDVEEVDPDEVQCLVEGVLGQAYPFEQPLAEVQLRLGEWETDINQMEQ